MSIYIVLTSILLSVVLFLLCNKDAESIIILMEQKQGVLNYKVGSQNFSSERLYDFLSQSIIKNEQEQSAILIVHETIAIADIINTRGVLQKIGFKSIRYFYHGDDKRSKKILWRYSHGQ